MSVTLEDVHAARERLAGQIARTPCLRSRTLSEITGAELWLKFENLQYTASFKERGALNRMAQLTAAERAAGAARSASKNDALERRSHFKRASARGAIVCDGRVD